MAEKQELNFDELENVAGGARKNKTVSNNTGTQQNSAEESAQQNNMNGDNINDIIQVNNVSGNSGNVEIKSPVTVKDVSNSTVNMNF